MKVTHHRLLTSTLLALGLGGFASAGVYTESAAATAPPVASEGGLSGTLSFDFNSHFISYGADVWGDGSSMSDPSFNPSIELVWDLPSGFSAKVGAWADVTSKGGNPIGGKIQEIDVWTGVGYSVGALSIGLTYQNWFYGSETEEILDLTFSYDTLLAPSLTIHQRLDPGASGGDNGTVLVLGLSHSVDLGPVSVSFPFNVAYFVDEGFHGGDDGIGYGSLGVAASLPLSFIDSTYGEWSLNGGLTYYVTGRDVIPGNVKGDFLTAKLGVSCAF